VAPHDLLSDKQARSGAPAGIAGAEIRIHDRGQDLRRCTRPVIGIQYFHSLTVVPGNALATDRDPGAAKSHRHGFSHGVLQNETIVSVSVDRCISCDLD
jgi:hypothetical protein